MIDKHIEKVRAILEAKELDAIFLVNYVSPLIDKMFFYVSDLQSGVFESSFIELTMDDIKLFTSKLEAETARKQVPFEVVVSENRAIDALKDEVKKYQRVGLNYAVLPTKIFVELNGFAELVDISKDLMNIRKVKDAEEIGRIKKAIEISERALSDLIDTLDVTKMTESEIAAELEYRCRKFGATGFAFDTIVAADENAADPHYKAGSNNKVPKKILLIDFGARYKGYVADITRTFLIGTPSDEIRKMYEITYEAQQRALKVIKAGVNAKFVDRQARELIEKHYGEFIHGLGHMIGLDVHEGEALNTKADWILEENHVFTVEPGVYVQGLGGIRIEDDVVVKKDGVEILSSFRKELDEIIIR
ncbi:MAG: M24 family metallopeptidase [Candidatus Asgardarchaeia archaeon]